MLSNATLGLGNDSRWGGEAPLWYYVLKEAELAPYNAQRLGPVGGRIVAEVLVGLLQRDPNSYLYLDAAWNRPRPSPRPPASSGSWTCCGTPARREHRPRLELPLTVPRGHGAEEISHRGVPADQRIEPEATLDPGAAWS